MTTTIDWLPAFLQANDPLFPTGAYAHSFALEEIVGLGPVRDEATLLVYIRQQVLPLQQHLELPFVRLAYEAAAASDFKTLRELNMEISAFKLARETRETSLRLGSRRLQTASEISSSPLLREFKAEVPDPHQLVVYALQMAVSGTPLHATLSGHLYQAIAATCSASLKLVRIGQEGIQRVLTAALIEIPQVVEASLHLSRDEIGWFNPVLEIAAMRHEFAEERLFIS